MVFDSGASLVVGTYTGNGPATQSIAGLGFSVDYNDTTRSAAATFSASTLGVR